MKDYKSYFFSWTATAGSIAGALFLPNAYALSYSDFSAKAQTVETDGQTTNTCLTQKRSNCEPLWNSYSSSYQNLQNGNYCSQYGGTSGVRCEATLTKLSRQHDSIQSAYNNWKLALGETEDTTGAYKAFADRQASAEKASLDASISAPAAGASSTPVGQRISTGPSVANPRADAMNQTDRAIEKLEKESSDLYGSTDFSNPEQAKAYGDKVEELEGAKFHKKALEEADTLSQLQRGNLAGEKTGGTYAKDDNGNLITPDSESTGGKGNPAGSSTLSGASGAGGPPKLGNARDGNCPTGVRLMKDGKYGCDTTKSAITGFQAASTGADMIGQVAGTVGSAVAQGSATSGKMSETYFASGTALEATSITQYTAGAVNIAAAVTSFVMARGHGNCMDEIKDQTSGDVVEKRDSNGNVIGTTSNDAKTKQALSNMGYDQYSNTSAVRGALDEASARAISEQEIIKSQADIAAATFASKGAAQIAGGIASKIQADQNYKMGRLTRENEGMFNEGGNYNGATTTDDSVVPDIVTPGTDHAVTDNITDAISPTSAGDPNNYGVGGGPLLSTPTTAGGGGSGGTSGGGGGALGGGGTAAATDEKSSDAPSLANAGKQPFYSGTSSGSYSGGAKGGSTGSGKGGIGDLAAMLANAFGKKEEDKAGPKSILDFAQQTAAANASLLSPEVNIFARIHDAYQEKQKTNLVGLNFPGRALASEPPKAGARK